MSLRPPRKPTSGEHFTPFYSVAEEAMAKAEEESWDNEGGHMSSTCGRVVCTPAAELPYKVILQAADRASASRARRSECPDR
jgi:hypothetical protein